MLEIKELTERVQELSKSVDLWNTVMLWGLFFAAVAAAWVGISTRLVIVRTGQQAKAEELLNAAKERQLQADLKEKDVELGKLKLRSDTAEAEIATARGAAAGANERAAKLEREAEDARLETNRIKSKIMWRELSPGQVEKLKSILACKKILIGVVVPGDNPEAREYGQQIANVLESVGCLGGFVANGIINPPASPGLSISSSDLAAESSVISAFESASLPLSRRSSSGVSVGGSPINLYVGAKPRSQ